MAKIRLQSLRLQGFKSFPDPVELAFPGQVAAIIGPNGCGKSNVVDAMVWVLGEQSPSLLRLKAMGDVVFSGATGRAPAGVAEVALRLHSDDGRWEATGGSCEISRRVYRSGPSEYRVNGRLARLRDVADELLSVGLGTRDYAIIEQGRVGQVLSARPTDRRLLLEEAAGISRYRARRHDAELKLEHTRGNLQRLEDVIGEVERSLRQMKRQARQAEQYHHLEGELKEQLRRLFVLDAHHQHQLRSELVRRRGQAQNEVAAAAAGLASAEADLADARAEQDRVRAELEASRSEVSALLTSHERLEAFLERSADLVDQLRATLERSRAELEVTAARQEALGEETEAAEARRESLAAAALEVRQQGEAATAAHTASQAQLKAAEQQGSQRRQELLRLISTLTSTRNQLGELEREQDRLAYAIGQLEAERGRLEARRVETRARYDAASAASRQAAAHAEALEQGRHGAASERTAVAEQAAAARHEAETLAHTAWDLRHRLTGVERELARHAAVADQLTAALPDELVLGVVSDVLDPEPGAAADLDRVWRDWLELPVLTRTLTDDEKKALEDLEGRIRLVVSGDAPPRPAEPPPDGAEPLFDRAGMPEEHRPWLERTLPRAFRCADGERARQLADQLPDAVFLGPDGTLWHGRTVEPATAGTRLRGALALREARADLARQLEEITLEGDRAAERRRDLDRQVETLDARLAEISAALVEAEQGRARATALEQALGQELGRVERELEASNADAERHRRRKAELGQRRTTLAAEVEGLEARNRDAERLVEEATARVEALRDSTAEALRRRDRWQAEARLAGERLAAAAAECQRLAQDRAQLAGRRADLQTEVAATTDELAQTEAEVVTSRGRLAEEQGMLASARERERGLQQRTEKSGDRVERLDEEVRTRRRTHDLAREALHAVEVEQTRLDGDWQHLRDGAAADLGVTLEQLLQEEPAADVPAEALRATVEQLRAKLEGVGPVNLLAVREAEELGQRLTFLSDQRKDLLDGLRSLEQTIRDIDATCTERFVETFEQVNLMFARTFLELFGGGTARLELVDEDSPLDSGIDIVAQPPGKRTQSVQLLSGGEKALAALSLLIALFRIKPSPFCILDEVDAPLDDANVERLADLIQSMADHTQFVLVTHNRRTMAHAEALYGVTMEEPGVSKVVSVHLEK